MQSDKSLFQIIRELPKAVPTSTSANAKWGLTSILFSLSLFLFPVSLAFWAISISLEGGKIMLPSSLVSWVFAGLAGVSFLAWVGISIFALKLAARWYRLSPTEKDESQQINDAKDAIITEIRGLRKDLGGGNDDKPEQ